MHVLIYQVDTIFCLLSPFSKQVNALIHTFSLSFVLDAIERFYFATIFKIGENVSANRPQIAF